MGPQIRYPVSTLLTSIAGYVDAVGWLTYKHTYTANMSGNSVAIGIQGAAGDWGEALLRMWPVAVYVIGLIGCRVAVEIAARRGKKRIASLMFFFEIVFLAAAMVLAPGILGGIALLALAMGIQNAALTRFGGITLHSGFVTGTLVKFSEQFSKYLSWLSDGGTLRGSANERSFRYSIWMISLWMVYVLGALAGALADHRWALPALAVPIIALAGLAAYDVRSPLAVGDEREQLKDHA